MEILLFFFKDKKQMKRNIFISVGGRRQKTLETQRSITLIRKTTTCNDLYTVTEFQNW